jgi:acyl-coenzyme A synthetase/AMP-(fatty) acid ligase
MSFPRAQAGAQHLAVCNLPDSISVVDRPLPYNPSGKILGRQLRESPLSGNL